MDWNDTIWSRASSTVNYVCCCVRHSKKQLERESPFKRAKLATIVYTINARGENDCLKWLPPPSWRYTTAQRCHVANRRTVAKCQLSYVDLRPSHMRGAIIRTHTQCEKNVGAVLADICYYLPQFRVTRIFKVFRIFAHSLRTNYAVYIYIQDARAAWVHLNDVSAPHLKSEACPTQ